MKETQNKFKDMVTLADIVFYISLENNTKKSDQTFFFRGKRTWPQASTR